MAARESELSGGGIVGQSTSTGSSTGNPVPPGASSDQLRDEIRRTRAGMDETVDALTDRLKPRHLLDDLLDLFKSGSPSSGGGGASAGDAAQKAKEFGSAAFQKLRNNPMPAALIGAGIAWLIFDQASGDGPSADTRRATYDSVRGRWRDDELREHSGSYVDARTGQPYDASYGAEFRGGMTGGDGGSGASGTGGMTSGGDMEAGASGAAGGPGMLEQVKDKAGSAAQAVSGAVSGAMSSVTGAASSAADKASEWAGGAAAHAGRGARDWSGSAYGTASQGMQRGYDYGRRTFESSLNEYPLAVVAASLAAGVLTGLLLPGTRREDELMGEQSDALKRQAKDAGKDLVDRGKQVATATADAVTGEAEQQGLTPDTLADKVKNVARDVAGAAKESFKREGLDDLAHKGQAVVERGKEAAKEETRQQKDKPAPM